VVFRLCSSSSEADYTALSGCVPLAILPESTNFRVYTCSIKLVLATCESKWRPLRQELNHSFDQWDGLTPCP